MRVLVCGGRDMWNRDWVYEVLDRIHKETPIGFIIQGGARGADRHAYHWSMARGVESETYRPEWDTHGKAAGYIRNQRMLLEGAPDLVVAFPGGRGTADMVKRSKDAGVEVKEIR